MGKNGGCPIFSLKFPKTHKKKEKISKKSQISKIPKSKNPKIQKPQISKTPNFKNPKPTKKRYKNPKIQKI
jgi:hypothetical protein